MTRKADGYNETFSWRKVAGEIDRLLENETYLSDDESKLYQYNEQIFSNFQESPLFEFDKLDNGQVNVFLEDELVARIDTVGQVSYVVELEDRFKFEIDEYVQNLETSLLIEKISQHEQLDLFDDSAFDDSSVDDTISVAEGINSADQYLSGNIREKMAIMDFYIERYQAIENPDKDVLDNLIELKFQRDKLQGVMPKELTASEISVRLGTTWIPTSDINQFIFDTLQPGYYAKQAINVHFSPFTSEWKIDGKTQDSRNDLANLTYGTSRVNAYRLIEDSLNLRDTRVYDTVYTDGGDKRQVLNKKETMLAGEKQELLKEAFKDWIFNDQRRRHRLEKLYNEKFIVK
ncbi:hypothetical protein NF437_09930 [Streptococcus suis]|nr:hypothetical protein [Streptococcus suis]